MDFFSNMSYIFWLEAILRLLLGFILSGVIGLERNSWNKPAGFRTHALVGISAVLIMLCGEYMSNKYDMDPSRIPAQLLSGIGFIGAGTILRDGFHVKGLTTAASLLAVTGIGLLVGAGAYIIAIIATLFVYIILSYTYVVSDSAEKYSEFSFKIYTDEIHKNLKEIEENFIQEEILLKSIKTEKDFIVVKGKISDSINRNKLITNIMQIEDIKEIIEE